MGHQKDTSYSGCTGCTGNWSFGLYFPTGNGPAKRLRATGPDGPGCSPPRLQPRHSRPRRPRIPRPTRTTSSKGIKPPRISRGQAEEQEAKGPDKDNIQQDAGNQVQDGKPDVPGATEAAGK